MEDEDHVLLGLAVSEDLKRVQKYAIRPVLLEAETHLIKYYKSRFNQRIIPSSELSESFPSRWPSSLDSLHSLSSFPEYASPLTSTASSSF